MPEANVKQQVADAADRLHWRTGSDGGFEYVPVPGLVGGYVGWDRPSQKWGAALANFPRVNRGENSHALAATGFSNPLAAQQWVEAAWDRVRAARDRN